MSVLPLSFFVSVDVISNAKDSDAPRSHPMDVKLSDAIPFMRSIARDSAICGMEIEELQSLIWIMNGYRLPQHVDIVLTGGEPLIYANEPIFVEFIDYLISQGHRVTFETNATIAPDFVRYPFYRDATYALSVKLSNSGEPYESTGKAGGLRCDYWQCPVRVFLNSVWMSPHWEATWKRRSMRSSPLIRLPPSIVCRWGVIKPISKRTAKR